MILTFEVSVFSYITYVVVMLYIAFKRIEAWPFSAYPMFSQPITEDDIVIFRMSFELEDKSILWLPKATAFRKKLDQSIKLAKYQSRHNPTNFVKIVSKFYAVFLLETKNTEQVNRILLLKEVHRDNKKYETTVFASFTIDTYGKVIASNSTRR